jgi:tetratricopeptide (TPR) repeat protein
MKVLPTAYRPATILEGGMVGENHLPVAERVPHLMPFLSPSALGLERLFGASPSIAFIFNDIDGDEGSSHLTFQKIAGLIQQIPDDDLGQVTVFATLATASKSLDEKSKAAKILRSFLQQLDVSNVLADIETLQGLPTNELYLFAKKREQNASLTDFRRRMNKAFRPVDQLSEHELIDRLKEMLKWGAGGFSPAELKAKIYEWRTTLSAEELFEKVFELLKSYISLPSLSTPPGLKLQQVRSHIAPYEEMKQRVRRLAHDLPKIAVAFEGLGLRKEALQALQWAEPAIAFYGEDPCGDPILRASLALAQAKLGMIPEAKESLHQASSYQQPDPEDEDSIYELITALQIRLKVAVILRDQQELEQTLSLANQLPGAAGIYGRMRVKCDLIKRTSELAVISGDEALLAWIVSLMEMPDWNSEFNKYYQIEAQVSLAITMKRFGRSKESLAMMNLAESLVPQISEHLRPSLLANVAAGYAQLGFSEKMKSLMEKALANTESANEEMVQNIVEFAISQNSAHWLDRAWEMASRGRFGFSVSGNMTAVIRGMITLAYPDSPR